jgi:phage repressor protein C with HTH and peptisase S24 domain
MGTLPLDTPAKPTNYLRDVQHSSSRRVAVAAVPALAVPDGRGRRYGSAVTVVGRIGVAVAVTAALGWVAARARAVAVSGPSMVPTLVDGDALLAYPVRRVRPGDVVIARFRSRPDLLVVKRAVRPCGDGWWIEGDNPLITDDSRKYGEAVVLGRVLFRYWRAPAANQVRDCSVHRRGRSPGR